MKLGLDSCSIPRKQQQTSSLTANLVRSQMVPYISQLSSFPNPIQSRTVKPRPTIVSRCRVSSQLNVSYSVI